MIALLTGRVAAAALGQMVVDVGGVGYRVLVPPATAVRVGDSVTLHTFLAVREDALTLYGFRLEADRNLFEVLLSVTGVGPKLALAAIATLGAGGLRRAVIAEDVAALMTVPGVGRKGAQRMILELRERLGALDDGTVPGDGAAAGGPGDPRTEVRQALLALGYAPAEVQRTLEALPSDAARSTADHPRPDRPRPEHSRPDEPGRSGGSGSDGQGQTAEELLRMALRSLGADR